MLCEKCGTKVSEDKSHCARCEKSTKARRNKTLAENSMESRQFYVHSGKIAPQLVLGVPILFIISTALAFAYAYSIVYVPYIYVKFLLTLGFAFGVGFSTAIVLQFFKTRNTIFALCFGLVSGLFALYAAWVTFEYVFLDEMYKEHIELTRLANPRVAWQALRYIAETSQYSIAGMTISGLGLWSLWAVEACIILGACGYLAHSFIKDSVFCEACKGWTDDHKNKLTFEYLSESELKQKLTAQDLSFLDDILKIKRTAESFYRIDCAVCCTCENLYTLSLLRVTRTYDKEGKETDKEKFILKNLFICKETFEKLTGKKQAAEAPEPVEKAPTEEVVTEQ